MSTGNNRNNSKKNVSAILVAFLMTALVGTGMFAFGLNAFFNKDIQTASAATKPLEVNLDGATPEQLRAIIAEYQTREGQYLAQLTDAAGQLDQANAQVQNYQSLLNQLVQAGVIRIDRNGVVTVMTSAPQSSGGFFNHESGERDNND